MKLRELLKKMEKNQAVMITQEVCVAQCTAGAALDYRAKFFLDCNVEKITCIGGYVINVDLVPDE